MTFGTTTSVMIIELSCNNYLIGESGEDATKFANLN
jgi:hypothetical protein